MATLASWLSILVVMATHWIDGHTNINIEIVGSAHAWVWGVYFGVLAGVCSRHIYHAITARKDHNDTYYYLGGK